MVQYIKRETYLQKLIDIRDNGEIKVITGSRRCGKSWLLSRIYKDWLIENGVSENNIILITFDTDELEDTDDIANPKVLKSYLLERLTFKKIVILGDDIAQYTDENGIYFLGLKNFLLCTSI